MKLEIGVFEGRDHMTGAGLGRDHGVHHGHLAFEAAAVRPIENHGRADADAGETGDWRGELDLRDRRERRSGFRASSADWYWRAAR